MRPPFYAFELWQRAVRSNSKLLPARAAWGDSNGLKVWPLWGEPESELRIVVINKRAFEAGEVTLRAAGGGGGGWGDASVTRLVARGDAPLEKRDGISIGGQSYITGGRLTGAPVAEGVTQVTDDGKPAWKVYMPAGSAALVVIKRA